MDIHRQQYFDSTISSCVLTRHTHIYMFSCVVCYRPTLGIVVRNVF